MRVSLIVTTYNWKEALAVVLASALRQTRLPDEIIVADDGSSDGTEQLVANIAAKAPIPVLHSWQEDKGFRAAMSRNKAISKASGEYIILIDGDIVLERYFVEDHLAAARQGFFVQGGRVLLNEHITVEMLAAGKLDVSFFDPGLGNRKNYIRFPLLSRIFSGAAASLNGIKTCNFAFWKADAMAINGFNEDFVGWGREDSDFAARLQHYGVCRKNLRHSAITYHLYHPEQPRNRLSTNDNLLTEAICCVKKRCPNGIDKYLD